MAEFEVKGEAIKGASGVNRASEEGKLDYTLLRDGPMFKRWASLLTRAIPVRGRRNWMNASGKDDLDRFTRSAARHFEQWLDGEMDEDHAAAVIFNINGAEYVRAELQQAKFEQAVRDMNIRRMNAPPRDPLLTANGLDISRAT